jgi:L-alanine-DL-glutamate epimerase-like enolase superfamily enzyme
VDAAVTHLASSTVPRLMPCGHLPGAMVTERIARGAPVAGRGRTRVPHRPGLGVEVDETMLGEAVLRVG